MKEDKPSETALGVAGNLVAAALDPELRKVVAHPDEPYAEWFVNAFSPFARFRLKLWKWGPFRRLLYSVSDARLPGGALHLLVRKRFMEDAVRNALEATPRPEQMVVFAGGLDPLSLRLAPQFPEISFVELDHPATQAVKRRAIEEHKAQPANFTLLPVDFNRQSAEEALHSLPGFRPQARRVFLAEGLLMYLDAGAVDQLFACVRNNSLPGSRFLFSFLDQAALDDPNSPVAFAARVVEKMGEPYKFAIERKKLEGFLRKHGFRSRTIADHRTLKTSYLVPAGLDRPLLEGEVLVVSEKL